MLDINWEAWFNRVCGILLFAFGLSIEVKNFFYSETINGYEILFGIEFIVAGIFLFHGKIRGLFKGSLKS